MLRLRNIGTALPALIVTLLVTGCNVRVPAPPAAPATSAAPQSPKPVESAKQPAANEVATVDTTDPPVAEPAKALETPQATEAATEPVAAFYSVSSYDENRDPAVDLADTIRRATAENKRILIQVGGEWCGWCHRISKYMETNEKVRPLIDEHFIVMKVTYPGTHAESFLSQYPKVEAYPHLFVLEPDGKVLHSQGTAELEFEKGYNEEVFVKFLSDWKL